MFRLFRFNRESRSFELELACKVCGKDSAKKLCRECFEDIQTEEPYDAWKDEFYGIQKENEQ